MDYTSKNKFSPSLKRSEDDGRLTPKRDTRISRLPAQFVGISGTVKSKKTTLIVALAHDLKESGTFHLVFKPKIDTRDSGPRELKCRMGGRVPCGSIGPENDFVEIIKKLPDNKRPVIIMIDEGQFLTVEQVRQLDEVVKNFEIRIEVSFLKTDFKGQFFPASSEILRLCHTHEELVSYCPCGARAIHNARIDKNHNIIREGDLVQIGHNYEKLCTNCFEKDNVREFLSTEEDAEELIQLTQSVYGEL